MGKESTSKEKTPSESRNAKKSLIHEFEGSEAKMSGFMVQVLELLQKLNEKVDNAATRLLLLEKKVRELKKEVKLLRMGKGKMEKKEDDAKDEKRKKEERKKEKRTTKKEKEMRRLRKKLEMRTRLIMNLMTYL